MGTFGGRGGGVESARRWVPGLLLVLGVPLALVADPSMPPKPPLWDPQLMVDVVERATCCDESPRIHVTPRETVDAVRLELRRSDGHELRLETGRLVAYEAYQVPLVLEQPQGAFRWSGRLSFLVRGVWKELPVEIETSLFPPLQVTAEVDAVNPVANTVTVTASRPLARVEVRVRSADGVLLGESRASIPDAEASAPVTVGWRPVRPGAPVRVDVRAWDAHGYYGDLALGVAR